MYVHIKCVCDGFNLPFVTLISVIWHRSFSVTKKKEKQTLINYYFYRLNEVVGKRAKHGGVRGGRDKI